MYHFQRNHYASSTLTYHFHLLPHVIIPDFGFPKTSIPKNVKSKRRNAWKTHGRRTVGSWVSMLITSMVVVGSWCDEWIRRVWYISTTYRFGLPAMGGWMGWVGMKGRKGMYMYMGLYELQICVYKNERIDKYLRVYTDTHLSIFACTFTYTYNKGTSPCRFYKGP